ncbi:hypothetical protein JOL62DRAFT_417924 [Phyllosticta paracitricarpa]|uniref:Secreted protein n=1 Tax=Phyllosticta paracitricarpa TaxID=2016321 RepID=A0ABR1MRQ9_9PEZI
MAPSLFSLFRFVFFFFFFVSLSLFLSFHVIPNRSQASLGFRSRGLYHLLPLLLQSYCSTECCLMQCLRIHLAFALSSIRARVDVIHGLVFRRLLDFWCLALSCSSLTHTVYLCLLSPPPATCLSISSYVSPLLHPPISLPNPKLSLLSHLTCLQ